MCTHIATDTKNQWKTIWQLAERFSVFVCIFVCIRPCVCISNRWMYVRQSYLRCVQPRHKPAGPVLLAKRNDNVIYDASVVYWIVTHCCAKLDLNSKPIFGHHIINNRKERGRTRKKWNTHCPFVYWFSFYLKFVICHTFCICSYCCYSCYCCCSWISINVIWCQINCVKLAQINK